MAGPAPGPGGASVTNRELNRVIHPWWSADRAAIVPVSRASEEIGGTSGGQGGTGHRWSVQPGRGTGRPTEGPDSLTIELMEHSH